MDYWIFLPALSLWMKVGKRRKLLLNRLNRRRSLHLLTYLRKFCVSIQFFDFALQQKLVVCITDLSHNFFWINFLHFIHRPERCLPVKFFVICKILYFLHVFLIICKKLFVTSSDLTKNLQRYNLSSERSQNYAEFA